jgi:hypothetical protein
VTTPRSVFVVEPPMLDHLLDQMHQASAQLRDKHYNARLAKRGGEGSKLRYGFDARDDQVDWRPAKAQIAEALLKACPSLDPLWSGVEHRFLGNVDSEATSVDMGSLEGDRSPWSYFCASILSRKLYDRDAPLWEGTTHFHGTLWSDFHVIARDPLASPEWQTDWDWVDKPPADWRPQVQMHASRVVVRFYSICRFERQRISRHIDTYTAPNDLTETRRRIGPHGYSFRTRRTHVALGGIGYIT